MNFYAGMLGGFHVFVTVIIEVNASKYAYFDGVRQNDFSIFKGGFKYLDSVCGSSSHEYICLQIFMNICIFAILKLQ